MKATLTALLLTTAALAQAPVQPAPAPQQTDSPLASPYTLKTGTQLVILDVTVKDKHGNKIHGLHQSDFTVKESGHSQVIANVEEHAAPTAAQIAAYPAPPQLPPGDFTNFVTAPPTGALNIILVDKVNTAVKDQLYLRQQLIDYLKHARPDARTAIYGLNNHLELLQGFTSDPKLLLAALDSKKGRASNSVLRDDTSGGLTTSANSSGLGSIVSSAAGASPTGISGFEGPVNAYQDLIRSYVTLDGFNALARALITLPGRKNLIWFAGDFPVDFFPNENGAGDGPFADTEAIDAEYRDTINLLSRAQVSVYPVDAQGLRTDQANNASKGNASFGSGANARNEQAAHLAEQNNRAGEQQGMTQLARNTGGKAFYNHNDLSREVADAITDGADYYTIAYVPTGKSPSGIQGITVTIPNESYDLEYRRSYYTNRSNHVTSATNPKLPVIPPLVQALRPGAPPSTEILIRLHAQSQGTEQHPELAPGNTLGVTAEGKPTAPHPPYRYYAVGIVASARNIAFTHGPDEIYQVSVTFVTAVYSDAGDLIDTQSNSYNRKLTKPQLDEALKSGIHFDQQVAVPASGTYFLRIAVQDRTSNRTGAVELPVAAIPPPDPVNPPAPANTPNPAPAS